MESIFNKLGIYDFMGIWGPGAIFCVYCSFTFDFVIKRIISNDFSPKIWTVVLFYIGMAYIIGVIFHEIGKWVVDKITYFFDFDKYCNINDLKFNEKRTMRWFTPCKLQYEYKKTLNNCNVEKCVKFDKANYELIYSDNINCQRINKYHAVYGLSRGLCIGMIALLLFSFTAFIPCLDFKVGNEIWLYIVMDLMLIYILFCRTVRYFINWIKNVYIQYNIAVRKEIIGDEIK